MCSVSENPKHTSIDFSCLFWKSVLGEYSLKIDSILLYEQSPVYHADVVVHGRFFHTFGSGSHREDCVVKHKQPDDLLTKYYTENVSIYVKHPELAIRWLEDSCKTPAKFVIYKGEFFCPTTILDLLDKDDDCTKPETWKHLFCSKYVLLFLRYCHLTDNLEAPEEKLRLLWTINSNQCTPAFLRRLVLRIFHSEQSGYL